MSTTMNKQQTVTTLLNVLKKQYDPPEPEARPVLEQLLFGILREGTTPAQADKAFKKLGEFFFDWNEVRVSQPQEVAECLGDLPDAGVKAQRVVGLLQEVFESTFSFKLDDIDKKGLKNAAKLLGRMPDVSDFAVAWVIQRSLGGHAIPLDSANIRVLRRLGLLDAGEENLEAFRSTLEHLIPKTKGPMFSDGISQFAKDYCWENNPGCSTCPLRSECPTGQARIASGEAKSSRPKPR
jgi:endonuclease-3